jgi:ATP-dependent Clp protease ATP-binding subunit ClpA
MDHGKLTDHNGKSVDFRDVILIMTSNAGASMMAKAPIGFNRIKREGDDTEAINKLFTPEFRNRLDAVIPFAGLSADVIEKVVEKFVFQLEAQLADRGVTIELSPEASKWIGAKGYDEKFGARPLARVIQEHIKKPLAEELLFGSLEHGGTVKVVVEGEEDDRRLDFEYLPADPSSKKPESVDDGSDEVGDDVDEDEPQAALVSASPRKALPSPKGKTDKPSGKGGSGSGAVPGVPRKKRD